MKNHKLGSLKQQFWRPSVWNEGVSRPRHAPLEPGGCWQHFAAFVSCFAARQPQISVCILTWHSPLHVSPSTSPSSVHDSLPLLLLPFFFLIDFYCFMFTYVWLHWVFTALHGLSLVVVSRGCSLLAAYGLLLLQGTGSRDHGLSSCGTWA